MLMSAGFESLLNKGHTWHLGKQYRQRAYAMVSQLSNEDRRLSNFYNDCKEASLSLPSGHAVLMQKVKSKPTEAI